MGFDASGVLQSQAGHQNQGVRADLHASIAANTAAKPADQTIPAPGQSLFRAQAVAATQDKWLGGVRIGRNFKRCTWEPAIDQMFIRVKLQEIVHQRCVAHTHSEQLVLNRIQANFR